MRRDIFRPEAPCFHLPDQLDEQDNFPCKNRKPGSLWRRWYGGINRLSVLPLILILFFSIVGIDALGQEVISYEGENNNEIGQAEQFDYATTMKGFIGGVDAVDFFRLPLDWNADISVSLEFTNNGDESAEVTFSLRHSLLSSPWLTTKTVTVAPGETIQERVDLCGRAPDNYYLRLESGDGQVDFSLQWYPLYAATARPYNNARSGATPIALHTSIEGGINYMDYDRPVFPNLGSNDRFEYFKTTITGTNYKDYKCYITAQNHDCGSSGDLAVMLDYQLFRNNETTPFAQGQVGNTSGVGFMETVGSTIPLSMLSEGDELTIYLQNLNAGAFKFNLLVSDLPPYDDAEDNCCAWNAIDLPAGVPIGGNVGTYDQANETYIDQYDTYKIIVPYNGSAKFFVETRNDECPAEAVSYNYTLYADILDQYGNEISTYHQLIASEEYPNCNEILRDTVKIRGWEPGTYYIRLHSNSYYYSAENWKLSYRLKFQMTDSTGNNDVEPNGTPQTAIPLAQGVTARGHFQFLRSFADGGPDFFDMYKIVTTTGGRLAIKGQGILREAFDEPDTYDNHLNFDLTNAGAGLGVLRFPVDNDHLYPDSTYTFNDTTDCVIPPGTYYVRVTNPFGKKWEYEFNYEIIPDARFDGWVSDAEPNDERNEAMLLGGGASVKGRIGYYNNENYDYYDYYKIKFPAGDSLRLSVVAINSSCGNPGASTFTITGYRNNLNPVLFTGTTGTVPIGDTGRLYYSRWVPAGDSIILRVSGGVFLYQLGTGLIAPGNDFRVVGDTTPCLNTYQYKAIDVAGQQLTYHWSLPDGGGTLNTTDSIATITWNATGTRRIQVYVSNDAGNSVTKTLAVVVNGNPPTQTPEIFNFARTLSTGGLPPGASLQWFRNGNAIAGADQVSYYADQAGSYTARFRNDCGNGPASAAIVFSAAAQSQVIAVPATPDIVLSPGVAIPLKGISSSGLPVFYQKISGQAFIQNDSLFIAGGGVVTGEVIVKYSQPGDDVFRPAADIYDTIQVLKGNQAIIFDTIPDQVMGAAYISLNPLTTAGLRPNFTIVSGSTAAYINVSNTTFLSYLYIAGAGKVAIRGYHDGNANYNAATPVERSFCIGVRTLTPIAGDPHPCISTYRYTTQKIPGANFVWTLSGGGILTTHNDTAWVQWQTPGSYTLSVKANSSCDTTYSEMRTLNITTSGNGPSPVSGMQPVNQAKDQQLPLKLSWLPGANTTLYDLYLWEATLPEPITPFAANLEDVSYTMGQNASLAYNKTYKWKVVSRNPCSQATGPVQEFDLIPLPDLVVSDVLAPSTANSGQTISISWKVTNAGPGNTLPNATWYDGVYIAMDTVPGIKFANNPDWNATSWNSLTANGRPLLLGKKIRPTGLQSGQSYTNSLDFTLPPNYSFPVYVYVITDNEHPNWKILQVSVANDTARKETPLTIIQAPTPDLRVDSVFTPLTTFSGSTINITYRLKNYGLLTPSGTGWSDSIFISQNPLFNREACIPLKAPKLNGSYYPNAANASVSNTAQLQKDSMLTRSVNVVIPNHIFGTWFVYVKTNAAANTTLYEGSFSDNNVGQAQMQIILTPTPKLTINTLTVPVTSVSTTQPVGINWNIRNDGFTDNLEKNKGHYFYQQGQCPCYSPIPNTVCVSPRYVDSLAQGSSFWVDRVYLSTNPNGLDVDNALLLSELKHGVQQYAGIMYPDNMELCAPSRPVNVDHALYPGSNFPKTLNFAVPSDLKPGTYYLYVHTNATKTVFEYPGTPQVRRSDLPMIVSRPDVMVSSISVPANSTGGQPLTITYKVLNNGPGGVYNHVRHDRLYVSNFPDFESSATLVDTRTFTSDLQVGTETPFTFTYKPSAATSGVKYFYVVTNYDSSFRETNYGNNRSVAAGTVISAAIPSDLVVSSVTPQDTVVMARRSHILYSVTNNGNGATAGAWTDSLFISCSPVFNPATSYYVGHRMQSRELVNGSSYTDTITIDTTYAFDINPCFPETVASTAYFFVKTNADRGAYEGSDINNNVTGSTRIILNPLVDHIVTSVSGVGAASVGSPYLVNWRVKNQGYNPNKQAYYYSWFDAVYFSADSIPDINDKQVYEQFKYLTLNRNQDTGFSRNILLPNMPGGDYYVYVRTNERNSIYGEKDRTNNINFIREASGAAKKINVVQPPLADLVDTIISAPTLTAAGQPVTVVYKVTNKGTGLSFPGNNWQDRLLLSVDFNPETNGDRLLLQKNRIGALAPGASYYDTVTATIPMNTAPGNYILISQANANNAVVEYDQTNNSGFGLISVYTPPVTDLVANTLTIPDTVMLGYAMDTARWIVTNASPNVANGYTKDGIYLSSSTVLDSTAVLIGIKDKYINIKTLESDTVKMTPLVTGVIEGAYRVFVRTDVQNNIVESDKNNNVAVSSQPVYVKVKELPMNVDAQNTLEKTGRFYKLRIPDSLYGSTIMVTLKTPDSLTARNELYIGGGFVPTPANYDYSFDIPGYGNQRIVITDVNDTVYYIMYRCVSPSPQLQNVTLRAVKLPFAILDVHTNAGANIGNVTIRINGSLFRNSMVAKLSNGSTTITSSAVYYTNSTQVFATFNLQGKPLGLYDVTLVKPDQSEAKMPGAFSIVPANNGGLITGGGMNTGAGDGSEPGCDPGAASGLNSQLAVELVVPDRVLINRPVVIQLNYSNPTNFDVPAQTRILYSEEEVRMALTKAGVPTGTTSLVLELSEPGGPPGIIRAGGRGSILIYCVSPKLVPDDGSVLFKLK